MATLWDRYWTTDLETLEAEDKAASNGPLRRYRLDINTLELYGHCRTCGKPGGVYKRQYHDCLNGGNVQTHYIAPCDCRSETFDQYENATF